jgi:hypothetical protein
MRQRSEIRDQGTEGPRDRGTKGLRKCCQILFASFYCIASHGLASLFSKILNKIGITSETRIFRSLGPLLPTPLVPYSLLPWSLGPLVSAL